MESIHHHDPACPPASGRIDSLPSERERKQPKISAKGRIWDWISSWSPDTKFRVSISLVFIYSLLFAAYVISVFSSNWIYGTEHEGYRKILGRYNTDEGGANQVSVLNYGLWILCGMVYEAESVGLYRYAFCDAIMQDCSVPVYIPGDERDAEMKMLPYTFSIHLFGSAGQGTSQCLAFSAVRGLSTSIMFFDFFGIILAILGLWTQSVPFCFGSVISCSSVMLGHTATVALFLCIALQPSDGSSQSVTIGWSFILNLAVFSINFLFRPVMLLSTIIAAQSKKAKRDTLI